MPLSDEELEKLDSKPKQMAIGGEGGFQVDKDRFRIEKSYELVVYQEDQDDMQRIPLPCQALPPQLQLAIERIQVNITLAVVSVTDVA